MHLHQSAPGREVVESASLSSQVCAVCGVAPRTARYGIKKLQRFPLGRPRHIPVDGVDSVELSGQDVPLVIDSGPRFLVEIGVLGNLLES